MGTVKNMKQYEGHEAFLGVLGSFENFFENTRSVGLFFLHKRSYPSYFLLCEAVRRVLSGFSLYFMKIMKMYEGGLFNGFFAIRPSFPTQVMKLKNGSASYSFMNSGIGRGDPAPTVARLEVCCGV